MRFQIMTARIVVLADDAGFDVDAATSKAIEIPSRNPKGFFLMVEWDLHPTSPEHCLDNVVQFDRFIQKTALRTSANTLVLFTADYSSTFGLLEGRSVRI